jgi:hypothetical protein
MKKYIKVLEHNDLVRDADSSAIINIDNNSMNAYKREREFRLKVRKVVNNYDKMQKDIEDLKLLIRQLKEIIDNLQLEKNLG